MDKYTVDVTMQVQAQDKPDATDRVQKLADVFQLSKHIRIVDIGDPEPLEE